MFNIDGTLTIGFAYPNMYMGEDYNSPQSPYWAMKSFVALGLSSKHPFWTTEEEGQPIAESQLSASVKPPVQIVCHSDHHHFLLSSGQFCPWPLKATEAKYGKFAYSSQFGFSVPTGPLIQQMAPDSTLALSKDGGDTWRVPWKVLDYGFENAWLRRGCQILEEIPVLRSIWKPWKDADIQVHTLLIAPCQKWPDWHLRIHKIENVGQTQVEIRTVEGGFAIQGRESKFGGVLPTCKEEASGEREFRIRAENGHLEGTEESPMEALICSNAGSSGMRNIFSSNFRQRKGEILKPDSNTNLIWQRTLIPTIIGTTTLSPGSSAELVTAVLAIARRSGLETEYDNADIEAIWKDVPNMLHSGMDKAPSSDFIALPRGSQDE